MENILEFCKGFNIQMLLSVGAIMWYFSRHFDDKIDKLELRMGAKFEKMDSKFEKMDSELKEINRIQSARSDQLYQMFIDLLKSKK